MFRVGNYLRSKLRSWLGVRDPEPTVLEEAKRTGLSINNVLLMRAGEKTIVQRKVGAPQLPPGVVPANFAYDARNDPGGLGPYIALDSEYNAPSYAYANSVNCGLSFPGYAYLAELSQRSEYRAPSETTADEMTRKWLILTVKGKAKGEKKSEDEPKTVAEDAEADGGLDDKIEKLNEALECFKVRDSFRKLAELDGLFGRAQLFIDIDHGRNPDEARQLPLCISPETIPKGSLCGFKVIEPIWTTPFSYNATDPMADDFYKPRAWFVLGKRIHASRLLTIISREVPDILKPSYNFGGLSMSQLMEADVFQWLRTRNSVSDLVHNFSVMCLQTDMANILSGQPDQPGGLLDRAALFTRTRDNQGLTMLDKDREELVAVNVPLSGLDKLQAQAQEHQAAPSHTPLVKLLGVTPTGLNASSEGEIKVYYDYINARQQAVFNAPFNIVLQVLQLNLFGDIDSAIGFKWVELTAPTVKELAEIRKSDAETATAYVNMGAVSNEEVRDKIASDPDSGYDNLSGEAPAPPLEAEHEIGQEGAEADHKRNEEAAAAAHERTMEQQAAAAKDKSKAA